MKHTFVIAIDDGDCRYEYPLTLENGENIAIHDIYKKVCEAYKVNPKEGIYCPSKAKEIFKKLDIS